ncbi:MAG: DUF2585 family protein [bacterium]|nr:DUF2585 family protein [bacterium]
MLEFLARNNIWLLIAAVAGVFAVQGTVLNWLGQPFVCECGHLSLWVGEVFSAENSQQLLDWYSFSHIIHGFIFYWLVGKLFPRLPLGVRLLLALGIEAGWEMFENTPMVIEAYRQQALAQGYTGDSIINSLSDTLMMVGGFLFASRVSVRYVVAIAIAMELFTGFLIRDNLTLNVLNFVAPIPAIEEWQSGAVSYQRPAR